MLLKQSSLTPRSLFVRSYRKQSTACEQTMSGGRQECSRRSSRTIAGGRNNALKKSKPHAGLFITYLFF